MRNFKKIENLSVIDLYKELQNLDLSWFQNQISITSISSDPDNYKLGCGSLTHNWEEAEIRINDKGEEYTYVPEYENPYQESHFNTLCGIFENTGFELVYKQLKQFYNVGRIRLMKSKPKTCLSWHKDSSPRLHYPLKTQEGCIMVIEDECKHLPKNEWWWTNTTVLHTAFNGSFEDRIHLVVTLID